MQRFGFLKLRRILRVFRVFLGHGLGMAWRRLRPGDPADGPQRLVRLLEELGGTYIKFGQVLSLQPDALSVEYCNALFKLLDKVPPFAFHHVEQTFLEDLGDLPDTLFDRIERKPIGSASVGQVHVAELNGRKLAVKVRRPSVESDFAADILMMRTMAALIDLLRLDRWAWLARSAREFCTWTHEELDYRYEARFMAALGYNARSNAHEVIPELFRRFSTSRILVTGFMEGPMVLQFMRSLDDPDPELDKRLAAMDFDREQFARNIVRNFVSDAFRYGLFHADLHPANMFILRDNVVGYVDFGITGSLSAHSRRTLVSLTLALTRADLDDTILHFRSIADLQDDSDLEGFRDGLDQLMDKWFDRTASPPLLRTTYSVVMLDMLKLSRVTNVWPTPDVIRYLRSVITCDGLIGRFAPQLDLGAHLEAVCTEYLQAKVWGEWLSMEHMADLTGEGIDLLESGPGAAARALDTSGAHRVQDNGARERSLRYGLIALLSAFLASLGEAPLQWGINLFSAQVLVCAMACILLLRNLRRLL